jgi:hypothetical protein
MRTLIIICFSCFILSCEIGSGPGNATPSCGFHNGNSLIKGPDGGCYYINSNNNKTYVDRSKCKC